MAKKKRKPIHKETEDKHVSSGKRSPEDARVERIKYCFKINRQKARENCKLDKVIFEGLDFDHIRQKRRINAISDTLPMVQTLVSDVVDEYPEVFSVESDWIELNTYPVSGYDFTERHTHMVYAAAVWMLDQIKNSGKMHCLNSAVGVEPVGDLPPAPSVYDLCHGSDILQSVIKGIYTRNGNVALYNENRKNQIIRVYMDSGLADGTVDRSAEPCAFYNLVLSLIPPKAIEAAVAHYEAVYWDWVKRYYQTRILYVEDERNLHEQMKAMDRKEIEAFEKTGTMAGLALTITMRADEKSIPKLYSCLPELEHGHCDLSTIKYDTRALAQKKKNLEQKKAEALVALHVFWHHLTELPLWNEEDRVETFGREGAEIWKDFDTGDPYEMAFAFLYLLDSGSDLPWCYLPGTAIQKASAAKLPWARTSFNPMNDGFFCPHVTQTGEFRLGPADSQIPKRIKAPEMEDWYDLRYSDREKVDPELYNLSQIIYGITGCILPRNVDRYIPAIKTLKRYGITGTRMTHTLLYCMTLMGESRNRTDASISQLDVIDEEDGSLGQVERNSIESLQKQIGILKDELKKQKQQTHECSREARDMRLRYDALAQTSANDVQELHDLRELIFRQQEGSYDSAQLSDVISFPYRTERRIVVFGGHESWVKEIKHKLPTIRFVDRTAIPNANMIRNADAVWIQANAMCHSHFHKIVDEAKKSGIPIRYFSFASPIKCAEQLAQEDKKTAK